MPRRSSRKPPRRYEESQLRIRSRRFCRLCAEKITKIDYKNVNLLQRYITERGKIIPSRISGNCASHQRQLTRAIEKARIMALLPFVAE